MTLKEKVQNQENIKGTHVTLKDACITEMLSYLGYDFIWVDMEHTQLTCEEVYHHFMAAKAGGTPIMVRVPANDLTVTKKVLEMGIDGIIFPMVQNYEHAVELLSWTLYPPYGKRGCGPKGAVRYGLDREQTFYEKGHLELCRFIQIEQKSAALEADKIAQIPYLDGCILGMHDLSGSIQRLGDIFCEENVKLAKVAIEAFHREKKTEGISTSSTEEEILKRYYEMGISMISAGADYSYILERAQKTLRTIRQVQAQ